MGVFSTLRTEAKRTKRTLTTAIGKSLQTVTRDDCHGFFRSVGIRATQTCKTLWNSPEIRSPEFRGEPLRPTCAQLGGEPPVGRGVKLRPGVLYSRPIFMRIRDFDLKRQLRGQLKSIGKDPRSRHLMENTLIFVKKQSAHASSLR